MISGRGTATRLTAPTVLAVFGATFWYPSFALAQDGEADEPMADQAAPADEAAPDAPPKEPTDVTDEGVPTEAVEASEGVSEVEKAMEQVEEDTEEGLPAEFTIKFGDVHDWLRLTSGEWLKGKLKRMREDDIDFDSDKLDLVTFSWDKVDQLHSPRVNTYVFDGKIDVVGRAVVTKDKVLIETTEGVESFPRSDLLSIVEGEPRERNWWSTRLSVGFSGTAGNTNQGQLNAHWELVRAHERTRSQLSYDGSFGYANQEQTVNRNLGTVEMKLFISKRFFFVPATSEFLNDRFQNYKFYRTENPPPRADGTVPKKNDYEFIVSLALEIG